MKREKVNNLVLGLVVVMSFCLWVSGASAALLTNVTTDTVVVYDTFETATQVSHSAYPDTSIDADPVGITGTWSVTEGSTGGSGTTYPQIQVTDYATPGASEGNNYLRVVRPQNEGTNTNAILNGERQTSGTVHLEIMTYITQTNVQSAYVSLMDGSNLISTIYWYSNGELVTYFNNGYNRIGNGIPYVANEWKKLELNYVIGSNTIQVIYDDGTPQTTNVRYVRGGVTGLQVATAKGTESYFDAVPEPATIALLAVGGMGLFRKR